jgi:hypothetical protein
MSALVEIGLAAVLVLAAGIPFVIAFSKARKEMEADDDVQNR